MKLRHLSNQKQNENTKRPSWRLQAIIIAVTALSVIITVFVGHRSCHDSMIMALDQFNNQQMSLARSAASSIETYFSEVSTALSSSTRISYVQNMTPECLEHMKRLYEGFLPRTSIRRLDEQGVLRFIYPFEGWRIKLINRSYGKEAFFQKIRQSGALSVSGIIINEEGKRRIRIAVPVYSKSGVNKTKAEFKGSLVASFDLDDISRVFIAPIMSGKTGYAWLMNHEGYFIAHPEKEFVGKDAFTIRMEKNPKLSFESINQIQKNVLSGNEGIGRYVSGWHKGQTGQIEKLIAYSPVRIIDQTWCVSVVTPANEVEQKVWSAAHEFIYGFGFIITVLISAGSFIFISAYRWSYSLEGEVKKRTSELKEAIDYLDNLIRSSNSPVIVWDSDLKITLMNQSFEKMSGRTETEMIGQPVNVLLPEDTRSKSIQKIESASKGEGDLKASEIAISDKDGNQRTILWNSYNTYAEDGRTILATLAQGKDITDRKRAEEALRESEQKYRAVIEAQTDLICRYTSDWKITFVNEAYCRYFNRKEEDLIGRSFMFLIPEKHRKIVADRHFLLLNSEKKEMTHEHQVISGSGELKWQQWINRAIFDNQNHLIEFQSVGRDITDLKLAEEALTKTMKNLSMAQEMAHLGSWEWDIITNEVLWSDETYRLFGWKPQEIDVTLSIYIETVHPDDLPGVQEDIQAALDGTRAYVSEHRIIRTDGEIRIHHTEGEVVRDANGKPLKMAGIVQDITEQKRAEEEKNLLEAQLRHAQKIETMGTLVAGVAHEVNNPIASIIFDIPLLKKIWLDVLPVLREKTEKSPGQKYGGLTYDFLENNLPQLLSNIDFAANRVLKTVSKLKDFTKQSNVTDRRPIQVNEALENAVQLVHTTLKKSGIELKIKLGDNLPLIEGDLHSTEQIIVNIIINAIQSIDHYDGRIDIVTGFRKKDRHVFISITDNGTGVDPSISDRIFDPFVTNKQDQGGIGLGLSITYNIVEAQRGKITFKSKEGKGTTFLVVFPAIET